ncbi:putative zinc-finger containing protein [Namao virus]|nr:putative zinc-finger containing protein [Namao virus]
MLPYNRWQLDTIVNYNGVLTPFYDSLSDKMLYKVNYPDGVDLNPKIDDYQDEPLDLSIRHRKDNDQEDVPYNPPDTNIHPLDLIVISKVTSQAGFFDHSEDLCLNSKKDFDAQRNQDISLADKYLRGVLNTNEDGPSACKTVNDHLSNFITYYDLMIGFNKTKKIFKCTICDKTYLSTSYLKRHQEICTKKFTCDTCGKQFKRKQHLKQHCYIHTNQKPYFCPNCNKKFSNSGTYSRHITSKTCYMS